MDNLTKKKFFTTALVLLAVVSIFACALAPASVAHALMPSSYDEYISSLPSGDAKDWYFDENHLDLEYCISIVNSWKKDSTFDWDSLKNDPIVVAIVDSGIGYAYTVDGDGKETESSPVDVYKDGNSYKISSVFDDVLLTDADGNYVYKNTTSTVKIVNGTSTTHYTAVTDSGNIALDLVDNTDNNHGTHVTSTVALLIHAFGLEDYIKIMPIKANNKISKKSGQKNYVAAYENSKSDPVVTEALRFAEDNEADIVNLSLAAEYNARSAYSFTAFENSMLLVAAAGNHGDNSAYSAKSYYPAACSNVIGVMNYTENKDGEPVLSSASNYGGAYNIAAPGTNIIGVIDGDDGYGKLSGTSMASPIVSFCSALTLLRYRGYQSTTGVEPTTELLRSMINACANEKTADTKSAPVLSLKNLLTVDFLNDEKYSDQMYTDVTGIKIVTESSSKLTLGDSAVYFKASPVPSNGKTDMGVRWYLVKGDERTDLGDGNEIYLPVPSKVGEGYSLYCEYYEKDTEVTAYISEPFNFSVNYMDFDIKSVTSFGVVEKDGYIEFSLPVAYCNPTVAEGIVWYINGEQVGTGASYIVHSPESLKEDYEITASVWGTKVDCSYVLSAEKNDNTSSGGDIAPIIAGGVFCGIAVLAVLISVVVHFVKKKKSAVDCNADIANEFLDVELQEIESMKEDAAEMPSAELVEESADDSTPTEEMQAECADELNDNVSVEEIGTDKDDIAPAEDNAE